MQVKAVQSHIKVATEGQVHVLDIECPNCQTRYRVFAPLDAEDTVEAKAQFMREHVTSKCSTEHADIVYFTFD
jgi:hypothetical protein